MNHDYVNHGFILTVSGHNQYQSVFFVIIVNRAFVYYLAHPQTGGGGGCRRVLSLFEVWGKCVSKRMLVPAIRVMFLNPKTRYCFAKTIAQLLMLRLSLCARAASKI